MNNRRIVFVTGGQRSGKSVFAEIEKVINQWNKESK